MDLGWVLSVVWWFFWVWFLHGGGFCVISVVFCVWFFFVSCGFEKSAEKSVEKSAGKSAEKSVDCLLHSHS